MDKKTFVQRITAGASRLLDINGQAVLSEETAADFKLRIGALEDNQVVVFEMLANHHRHIGGLEDRKKTREEVEKQLSQEIADEKAACLAAEKEMRRKVRGRLSFERGKQDEKVQSQLDAQRLQIEELKARFETREMAVDQELATQSEELQSVRDQIAVIHSKHGDLQRAHSEAEAASKETARELQRVTNEQSLLATDISDAVEEALAKLNAVQVESRKAAKSAVEAESALPVEVEELGASLKSLEEREGALQKQLSEEKATRECLSSRVDEQQDEL